MGLRSDLFGSIPGQSSAQETFENVFRWGRDTAGIIQGGQLDTTTIDAGNTPTSVLRPGLLLGTITSSGNLVHYGANATNGSDVVTGILMNSYRMTDLDGNSVNRFVYFLAAGPVKASKIFGLDEQARSQMAGRFLFDDRGYVPNAGWTRVTAKPAGYTVTAADSGTVFTTTGATGAVTFVLPTTPAKGLRYRFLNTVNQNMVIQAASGKLIGLNNAAATTLTFSTASNKIGAGAEVMADETGGFWIAMPIGTATPTYA
jgi:hypothetical protein